MALVNKIDSNVTGLSYAVESDVLGVLPVTPIWIPLEPNDYNDFGAELTTIARNPINAGRQRKKGVVTDLDASGGFSSDFTQTNMQEPLESFFFAKLRRKNDLAVTTVVAATDTYNVAAGGAGFRANDLLHAEAFAAQANNGVHKVVSSTGTTIVVADGTVNDTAGRITRVGHEFAATDLEVDVSGDWPALVSTAKDLRQLGVIPGECIYIGGDLTAERFAAANNNGWATVYSVSQFAIELYKTQFTMTDDAGTGKTIRLFCGRVIKNEIGTDIIRTSLQLERKLGVPDTANPLDTQAEYLIGGIANEYELAINTADKITASLSFIGLDAEQRPASVGLKTGTRPAIIETDAFNTSTDVKRIKLSSYVDGDACPAPLFAFVQELSLSINNNCSPNKAIGVLGAFDVTAGTFEVSASLQVYFADVEAVQLVRENADTTLDFQLYRDNAGVSFDLPMLTLGDGRLDVAQDEPITLPLTCDAGTGAKFNPNMDHTLLMVFFDYLPNAAGA